MSNIFARRAAGFKNELNQSFGALIGICTGMLSDQKLTNEEIHFLRSWLDTHSAVAVTWPGTVIYARINSVLADGVITEEERGHLVDTLQQLIGGALEDLADSTHVTQLALDQVAEIAFPGSTFCFTGDFVFAPRGTCIRETEYRGGISKTGVSKKLQYLVVGGLGSPEWKHGSFGTKIEAAMRLKSEGVSLLIVHEDTWAHSLTMCAR